MTGPFLTALVALAACVPVLSAGVSERIARPTCFGRQATAVVPPGGREFFGTAGDDVIVGSRDDDIIGALAGNDRVCGLAGNDAILGFEGNDMMDGGAGNDAFAGGSGNDLMDGGSVGRLGSLDIVTFELSGAPVQVDLAAGRARGEGDDVLRRIETLGGSKFADTLAGDARINSFFPGDGDDVVRGAGGFDFVFFRHSVRASLAEQVATGEGSDRLITLEGLVGCASSSAGGCPLVEGGDVLIGDGNGNYLAGGDGDDMLAAGDGDDRAFGDSGNDTIAAGNGLDTVGGDAGDDRLDGGEGLQDTVSYLLSPGAITLDLGDGHAAGEGDDTITGVEGATGSNAADTLVGDDATNLLFGNGGNDRLSGGAGADFLGGGDGRDALDDGAGEDYCVEGESGARCETSGLPGPLPGRAERPPIGRSWVNHKPSMLVRRRSSDPLVARVLSVVRLLTGTPTAAERTGAELVGRIAGYEYVGVPTCFARARPSTTAIAPPKRVEPVGRDGRPEEALWRGTLYREDRRSRNWKPFVKTPWAHAQIAGGYALSGLASWRDLKDRNFAGRTMYSIPAGRYAWVGQIYWERSGGSIRRWIEPNIDFAANARPRKFCATGS